MYTISRKELEYFNFFKVRLCSYARDNGVSLQREDFTDTISEETLKKLEPFLEEYLLVRNPNESAMSYFVRIVKTRPELMRNMDTMLGIATVLQRAKTYEIYRIGN